MDDDVVVRVEHVSKKFARTLKRSMLYGVSDISRNALGMGSHPERLRKGEFWAVDDVSFELRKGEALGLIGPNGSGKSTLLKMLNGIYWPDKGKITIKGRVGALIEVGAGFHPMLTGRENIYVNAAILGMTKKEVDAKLDDIIKFADIGDFLDTPVKMYSSGMYVRLGFAVAVHCEPDVLLIDEILAVGDGAFKQKCFAKLNQFQKDNIAAIVFVSHDLYAVRRFCDKGIALTDGQTTKAGDINAVIQEHQKVLNGLLKNAMLSNDKAYARHGATKDIELVDVQICNRNGDTRNHFMTGEDIVFKIRYDVKTEGLTPIFQLAIRRSDGELVSVLNPRFTTINDQTLGLGIGYVECHVRQIPLLTSHYFINLFIYDSDGKIIHDWASGEINSKLTFEILPNEISSVMGQYAGLCQMNGEWVLKENV